MNTFPALPCVRRFAAATSAVLAVSLASGAAPPDRKSELTILAGTVIPVQVGALSSEKDKPGRRIRARVMQDVPLARGGKIRAGATVIGHVAELPPSFAGKAASLALVFDSIEQNGASLHVITHLRAIASVLEVQMAQIPPIGAGESEVYDWLTTRQVGGDVVYGTGGDVTNAAGVQVGRAVNHGVLVEVTAKPGTKCQGAAEGNNRPQAFWVFSSDACGVYGFSHLSISHAGRTDPVGEIVLTSDKGPLKLRAGSGLLLRVQ
jgi:hypothetical protein